MAPTIPNSGQEKLHAFMKVKSFVSADNPDAKEVAKYDEEISSFLNTIDNQKRFLNGRNSYAVGNRLYTLVWYLERIPDQPVTTPFGAGATEVKVGVQDDKPDTTPKA